jgi:membrane-associated phospholipid phosphatase
MAAPDLRIWIVCAHGGEIRPLAGSLIAIRTSSSGLATIPAAYWVNDLGQPAAPSPRLTLIVRGALATLSNTKFGVGLMLLSTLAASSRTAGQTTEPDQTPPVGVPTSAPPQSPASSSSSQSPPVVDRQVSWKLLIPNIVNDQERIWSFPARLAQGQNWIPTAAILGTTAGLFALDPIEASYFRRASTYQGFNNIFTGNATVVGTIVAPMSLYTIGLIRKDSKMQQTALLAGEAVADAEIVTTVLKDATKRVRPAGFPAQGNLYDSWFESSGSFLRGNGSFPSGHAIVAFSVATVIARRYPTHRWIPYVAYGAAALVGFSRLSLSAHFLSDVFMGGALGYSISRFTVLRQ